MITRDLWTDPDPQPGDFDADLDDVDPHALETHPGNPDAKITVIATGEDDTADAGSRGDRYWVSTP